MPDSLVTNASELIAFMNTFDQELFNDEMLDRIQNILFGCRLENTLSNRRKHIEYVGKIAHSKNSVPDSGKATVKICPVCGGKLAVRKATRGANAGKNFWGCSNYPRCRYTTDMAE